MPKGRQADRKPNQTMGKFVPDSRRAWVTTKEQEDVLYVNEPDEEGAIGSVSIVNVRSGRNKWTTYLTNLTLAELEAVERLYMMAFALAKPLAAERDRKAREDHEAQRGTDYRLYRRPPVTVGLEGDSDEHDQSIYFRPPPVPLRFRSRPDSGGDVRGDGSPVAADREGEDAAEDPPA